MEHNQNMIAAINHQRAIRIKFYDQSASIAEKTGRCREVILAAVAIVDRFKQEQEPMAMYGLSAGTKKKKRFWRGGR